MWRNIFSWFNKPKPRLVPDEQKDGFWKEFNKQGVLISEGNFDKGLRTGKWKLYYETGELVIEENYANGKMEGTFKSFYKNGRLISEGQYRDNKREGIFKIFNDAGDLVKRMIFKNDSLIEEENIPNNLSPTDIEFPVLL